MTRLIKTATTLLVAASIVAAGAASAATTLRIGWTTADSDVDPYAIAARYFAEELEKAAPGEFDVRFFPNHQLGDDSEMVQGMQLGTLDAGVITGTLVGTFESAFQINDLPFLYGSNEQAHKVLDGEVGEQMFERLESQGIVGLGFAEAGFRHTVNNVRPIEAPEDFRGIKLRVQPSDLFIATFEALNANPVPLAWSESFTAVQQRTVDGLEIPLAVIYANKYPEVTKYLSLTRHTYNALPLLMSKQFFDRLDTEMQGVVRDAAQRAIERQRETVAANEDDVLDNIREAGMQVNDVEDTAAFRDQVESVYDEYGDKIGADLVDKALDIVSE